MTEARIAVIADMMRALAWRRGKSGPELAAKWNLSLTRVEHLAAEASKRVRAELLDPERVSETVSCALDTTLRKALAANDHRNVIAAAKTWAEVVGSIAPQKHQHSVDLGGLLARIQAAGAGGSEEADPAAAGEAGPDGHRGARGPADGGGAGPGA